MAVVTCGNFKRKLLYKESGWQYHDISHDVPFGSRAIKGDKGEFKSRSAVVSGYDISQLHN